MKLVPARTRLTLRKETLRLLSGEQLARVAGASVADDEGCQPPSNGCPPPGNEGVSGLMHVNCHTGPGSDVM